MNYFQDFEKDQDGWRFIQGDGKIVTEAGGNHYLTGDEYVTDYGLQKIFKLPFEDKSPVTIKFKIKVPKTVSLKYLSCGFMNGLTSLAVPESDDQWHSCEAVLPPPPSSELPMVRIWAYQDEVNYPQGIGFDDIEIVQQQ
ncbi:hypothetical protein [Pseudomonas bijieensis]|uniref:Uncharacterized protein n=1 Tax=Pseudomonas bijieensis TaxID=2681983 RepID=A0A6N1CC40_9PSED|nr:hypothetical protein [Pseudomonas bijieensis]QKS81826.1 hypothetical protein GN234_07680 [Pseudomonas bijieensis]